MIGFAQKSDAIVAAYEQASTQIAVLKNNQHIVPIQSLEKWQITLSVSKPEYTILYPTIQKYTSCDVIAHSKLEGQTWRTGTNLFLVEVDLESSSLPELTRTSTRLHQIGIPYIVIYLNGSMASIPSELFKSAQAIVFSWGHSEYMAIHITQILFGARGCTTTLPFFANSSYGIGAGLSTVSIERLKYGPPDCVGIDGKAFHQALSLAIEDAILDSVFPGANLLVAKDGMVIFHEAFGKSTYANSNHLTKDAIYDLASITKVFAATLGSMVLHSQGQFKIQSTLSSTLPKFKHSNKGSLTWQDIMAHKARLPASITYYRKLLTERGTIKHHTVRKEPNAHFKLRVTDTIFANNRIASKLIGEIKRVPLLNKAGYVYSDLSMILLYQAIERITKTPFDHYMSSTIYQPLGADHTLFLPLQQFTKDKIVPTEQDSFFRRTLIHGYVHDENAALLGGISGHAGLFSNANDMAKIAQMLLNKGTYGNRTYLNPETIDLFTSYQFPELDNRRGLGWDKPLLKFDLNASAVARDVSSDSYGHSGFTGTFVWIDPKYQLTYILLSNRVHPTRTNNKISQFSIRPCIQQLIYDFMLNAESSKN